ncbi:MAG TPA: permease prefix domain 2-containing transporter [Vicinamibacterales bacterium]|nr:permease prefix domain 2-containing transporter [Vicinamibacterales bacterium]
MNPPRASEWWLRLLLADRDRETVSGDLLEEYREAVLPARGERAARRWYRRQVLGIAWRSARTPLALGALCGAALGAWILVDTVRQPLSDDDALGIVVAFAAMLAVWAAMAAAVAWPTRRLGHGVAAGLLVGAATLLVLHVAAIARVVMFVDTIRARDDWQNLLVRYHRSGFATLRAYAVYEYVRQTPLILAIGAVGGALSGAVGGLVARLRPR